MHRQTEARTGARGACARIGEKLTPMKPPAPHTSTVVPLPLPISIGIVSGCVFPWVQLRVTGRHSATHVRSADKCLRHALRQRHPAQVRGRPRQHVGPRLSPPHCPAAGAPPPSRPHACPHARTRLPVERHACRDSAPRTAQTRRRRGGARARCGGGTIRAIPVPSGCRAYTPSPPRAPHAPRLPLLLRTRSLPLSRSRPPVFVDVWVAASTGVPRVPRVPAQVQIYYPHRPQNRKTLGGDTGRSKPIRTESKQSRISAAADGRTAQCGRRGCV